MLIVFIIFHKTNKKARQIKLVSVPNSRDRWSNHQGWVGWPPFPALSHFLIIIILAVSIKFNDSEIEIECDSDTTIVMIPSYYQPEGLGTVQKGGGRLP